MEIMTKRLDTMKINKKGQPLATRVKMTHGGGVSIQTHGNKLAKALNTKRPDQSLFQNKDGYLTGGIKIRS